MCIYIYLCIYIYIYTHRETHRHIYTYIYIYRERDIYTHIYIYIYIYTYIHIHIHIYIYTHTCIHLLSRLSIWRNPMVTGLIGGFALRESWSENTRLQKSAKRTQWWTGAAQPIPSNHIYGCMKCKHLLNSQQVKYIKLIKYDFWGVGSPVWPLMERSARWVPRLAHHLWGHPPGTCTPCYEITVYHSIS